MALPKLLMMAGMGLGAAGQIQAGRIAESEAKSAEAIANYNAAVQEREAKAIRAKGAFDQTRQAKQASRIMGTLRAELAGQGAYGSGLLEEEQEAELELENFLIGYEAETAARRAESQAVIDRMSGQLAKQRGATAKKASYIGAGSTLLTGFGMTGAYGKSFKPTNKKMWKQFQGQIG